jgi:hypothetical protein
MQSLAATQVHPENKHLSIFGFVIFKSPHLIEKKDVEKRPVIDKKDVQNKEEETSDSWDLQHNERPAVGSPAPVESHRWFSPAWLVNDQEQLIRTETRTS